MAAEVVVVVILDSACKMNNLGEDNWVGKSRSTSFEDSSPLLSQDARKENEGIGFRNTRC